MEGDIVYSKSEFIERENARVRKMREAALEKCGTLALSCSAIDNKWGIWMEIGEEFMWNQKYCCPLKPNPQ